MTTPAVASSFRFQLRLLTALEQEHESLGRELPRPLRFAGKRFRIRSGGAVAEGVVDQDGCVEADLPGADASTGELELGEPGEGELVPRLRIPWSQNVPLPGARTELERRESELRWRLQNLALLTGPSSEELEDAIGRVAFKQELSTSSPGPWGAWPAAARAVRSEEGAMRAFFGEVLRQHDHRRRR